VINLKSFHLSTAMTYILHTAFSIVIGAIVTGLVLIGQNAFNGSTNLKTALLGGVAGMVVYFTSHIGALASSPQAAQAESDALGEVKQALLDLTASHQNLLSFLTSGPSAPQAPVPTQQAQVAQVDQVPFPQQAAAIPYQPQAWTAPGLQAMPQPPKG
jgi:hypothetical protein